jgi:hypothetical protein
MQRVKLGGAALAVIVLAGCSATHAATIGSNAAPSNQSTMGQANPVDIVNTVAGCLTTDNATIGDATWDGGQQETCYFGTGTQAELTVTTFASDAERDADAAQLARYNDRTIIIGNKFDAVLDSNGTSNVDGSMVATQLNGSIIN